jgi:predicted nucleotidyltransferase
MGPQEINIDFAKIIPALEQNGALYAGVFGSFARGTENSESDIDLLVRFRDPQGLFKLSSIEDEFSASLGRKVDLLTEGALSPYIKEDVMKDLIIFYGERVF